LLEYFDATKIGLTATPALHTTDIFGDPIYTYSYREAVIDGFQIDHEPPIRIETALTRAGIKFEKDEQLEVLDPRTGQIDLTHAPTKSVSRSSTSTNRSSRRSSTESLRRSWQSISTRSHLEPERP
jgi:type I site-specific restriction endonuclease